MANALKRSFKQGERVYVVDYWNLYSGAFEVVAEILSVNNEDKTFRAVLYGKKYVKYSFNDYGRLIFDTKNEAVEAADKLPKSQSTVYQIIGKRVYKKLVYNIHAKYIDGTYDLVVRLNKGKVVSTKEIGHTLFLSETEARSKK